MSDGFCPRQITFTLAGNPSVTVTVTEVNGALVFEVDAGGGADLRGLFFDIANGKEAGLSISGGGGYLTEYRIATAGVIDLDDGANMRGAVKTPFDIGIEWGTPGSKIDAIDFEVSFTLSNLTNNLTLDDIAFQRFGARIDSVGAGSGGGTQSSKLLGVAPAAPDAVADVYNIFEDGAPDAGTASKTPTGIVLNVLSNDTDADNVAALVITAIHDGPSHGSVTIAADGKTLIYTPDLDYSGTDSFYYCVSDGQGGQDNALVTINVEAVADDPVITWTIAQGANINEILLTVTATQNDADGSEYIDWIEASAIGGLPAGVTIAPASVNPAGTGASLVQQFVLTTPAATDVDFDLDFTARAVEVSNGDGETNTETQNILIDYTQNQSTLTYQVVNQSIWSTGDAFVFDYDRFLGVDFHESGGDEFTVDLIVDEVVIAGYEYEVGLTAGFDIDVHIEGGGIDATVPIDLTVNTTFNKTTDAIYVDSAVAFGSGGSFSATGPEGHIYLDFLFNYIAYFSAYSDIFPDINIGPFTNNFDTNLVNLNTADPAYTLSLLGGIVEVALEWPHLAYGNDPGLLSGSGASNNFLEVGLDVDQLANYLLGGALSFLDADPSTEDNFELLDLDIVGGLNLLQSLAINLASSQMVTLILEDGAEFMMTLGTGLMIENASSHDLNGDGHVEMSFDFAPLLEMTNETVLGGNMSVEFALIRNLDLGVTDVTLVNDSYPIVSGPLVTVYEDTFALETDAVIAQSVNFIA